MMTSEPYCPVMEDSQFEPSNQTNDSASSKSENSGSASVKTSCFNHEISDRNVRPGMSRNYEQRVVDNDNEYHAPPNFTPENNAGHTVASTINGISGAEIGVKRKAVTERKRQDFKRQKKATGELNVHRKIFGRAKGRDQSYSGPSVIEAPEDATLLDTPKGINQEDIIKKLDEYEEMINSRIEWASVPLRNPFPSYEVDSEPSDEVGSTYGTSTSDLLGNPHLVTHSVNGLGAVDVTTMEEDQEIWRNIAAPGYL